MLLELGVDGVILGHSERRQYFGETDEALARKVPAALAAGLSRSSASARREDERDAGETERRAASASCRPTSARGRAERLAEVVIAYEPIWAIGTGRTATPEQAQEAIAFIRALLRERGAEAAERCGSSTAAR